MAFHPVWLLVGVVAVWLVTHILRRLWNWLRWRSGLFGPARALRRQRAARGDALAAIVALVFGEDARADRLSARALKSDPGNDAARTVAALLGDEKRLVALEAEKATRPVAALARLRGPATLTAAETAAKAVPNSPAAWRGLMTARAEAGDWDGALAALKSWRALDDAAEGAGDWTAAAILTAAADAALDGEAARAYLTRALKAQPRFAPAAARLAELAEDDGDIAAAERLAERAWAEQPTPRLGHAYAELQPLETDAERLTRIQRLAATNPANPESRLMLAAAALTAGDPALALEEVGPLLGTPPVRQRAAALALEAHRRLGMEPPVGAAWLDAAESGALGLRWACAECRWQAPDWRFDCGSCGRLGTMLPDEATPALPA